MSALELESAPVIPQGATLLHVCSIDETQQGVDEDSADSTWTWRDMPMLLWAITRFAVRFRGNGLRPTRGTDIVGDHYTGFEKLRTLWMYACEYPSRRKRNPMNVEEMIERWVPIIRGLATGHDKATIDHCEFEMERHIMPMLSAPVKQLREFYSALVAALKSDPTIPMFVWTMFEAWGETILKKAPDGEVVTLKKQLAARIADMVEKDVHADLKEALIGALCWRGEGQLKAVEESLTKGESKPRLRGKESCLFLVVGEGTPQQVEVML